MKELCCYIFYAGTVSADAPMLTNTKHVADKSKRAADSCLRSLFIEKPGQV
jgi:hypothetical protein